MDYLDPEKKRAHRIRLFIGYALLAVAIGVSTLILAYLANGYYVDRDTGEIIQNGLVFVDSNPSGADVYLNGEKQSGKTDARLVIPGGSYDIGVYKPGYRNWTRSLTLEGGSLRRLTYARLIPDTLETKPALTLQATPANTSQSIDKRWLFLAYSEVPLAYSIIDLSQAQLNEEVLSLPAGIVSAENGILEVVEWTNDDKYMLATYTAGESVEYLLLDRTNGAAAINLTTTFKLKDAEIALKDRTRDMYFVYRTDTNLLYEATLESGISESPIISIPLLAYKTFVKDWVLYVTSSGDEGLVDVRFKRGDKDILIKQIRTDKEYFLELAKLGNAPIMALSSPIEDRAIVYYDPEKYLNENPQSAIPVATTVLRVPLIKGLSISSDSSVVLAYGPENVASHEFDADRSYNFVSEKPLSLAQEPRWMDGQHFLFSTAGVQQMVDFDGSNQYELVESLPTLGSYYDDAIERMFTFTNSAEITANSTDVAKTITTLSITELLIEADR
jgi:hypothetical protein